MNQPIEWDIPPEKLHRFVRNDGELRNVVIDRVVVLGHSRCAVKRGLTGCYPWVSHIVFTRQGGTLSLLCNAKKVLMRNDGWWNLDADVLAILDSGHHALGSPYLTPGYWATTSGTYEEVAGHRLCTNCELVLDHLNRIEQGQPEALWHEQTFAYQRRERQRRQATEEVTE